MEAEHRIRRKVDILWDIENVPVGEDQIKCFVDAVEGAASVSVINF